MHVYTDASGVGYGGHVSSMKNVQIQGHWSLEQSRKSSTFRELLAIFLVLDSLSSFLQHKKVKIFSDSQSACRIVLVGSRIPELHEIAVKIFHTCLMCDIALEAQWLPRSENHLADCLSKAVDFDDWKLNPQMFNLIDQKWGPFSVDRFSSNYNNQIERFNSRFWCPEAEAVDAFSVNWADDINWVCPPVCLIIPTIRHMCQCNAKGTLIIPCWRSAAFWPMIMPEPAWEIC